MKPITSRIAVVDSAAQGVLELLADAGLDAVEVAPNKAGLKLAMLEQIAGVSIDDIINSLPKGSTPNKYKPHQGKREMERRAKKMKGQS